MRSKIFCIPLLAFASCFTIDSSAQNNPTFYDWFDNATGRQNASIYNGPIYFNSYRTTDASNNPFLTMDEYSKGNVVYDGQLYTNFDLKYDTNRDLLLLQPIDNGSGRSINLITQKVASFTLLNKRFVNLSFDNAKAPSSINGFYQENVVGKQFTFYVKYLKNRRDKIYNSALFDDFTARNEFVVFANDKFYTINSKKDVVSIFPTLKTEINKYYSSNNRASELQFMEGLFTYINTLLK